MEKKKWVQHVSRGSPAVRLHPVWHPEGLCAGFWVRKWESSGAPGTLGDNILEEDEALLVLSIQAAASHEYSLEGRSSEKFPSGLEWDPAWDPALWWLCLGPECELIPTDKGSHWPLFWMPVEAEPRKSWVPWLERADRSSFKLSSSHSWRLK